MRSPDPHLWQRVGDDTVDVIQTNSIIRSEAILEFLAIRCQRRCLTVSRLSTTPTLSDFETGNVF